MNPILRWTGRLLGLAAIAAAALFAFGPYEPVDTDMSFDPAALGDDPAAYFAAQEARFDDIRPNTEKRILWAGQPGARTPLTVLYFHGFSATAQEIRPVPDRVAEALGANLVFTRFTGHGRSADAMAEATAGAWLKDAAEAMAVARAVGDEVLILSTSTGGTLAALTALDPQAGQGIKGIVFVAPNFGINNPAAPVLTFPAARVWLPKLFGARRSFEPRTAEQAKYWTTEYPSVAVLPLAALVKHAVAQDWGQARVPALFYFSDADQVVVSARTHEVAAAWGGPVTQVMQDAGPGVDPSMHVIAGDIISPATTEKAVVLILEWAKGL